MKPEDVIVIAIIAVILTLAVLYVVRAKRRGQVCIGCPHAKGCAVAKKGKCACGDGEKKKK